MRDRLDKIYDAANSRPRRPLTREERAFISNELLMSTVDYCYWSSRYCHIILNDGGLGTLTPWGTQEVVLQRIAQREEECWAAYDAGEPVEGILIVQHKARQLGATALWRGLIMHRLTTTKHIRGITASIDDDKIEALSLRDKRILENLPWWMRPSIGFDTKGGHLQFDKLDSTLIYQDFRQMSGLGQGEAFELGHMTECASHPYPGTLEHDFFPTIPQSLLSLHGMESTAEGRKNWWHDFTERVRNGHSRRWVYIFVPWYAEPTKYRAKPPSGWQPSQLSLLHAQKVHDTSPQFLMGRSVMLTPEQLYWWESTRAEYQRGGSLNLFYTAYPSTPEESFQHTTVSAFSSELLEELRAHTLGGEPYELRYSRG